MPAILPPEVPAHVRNENHVQNHVQVNGGTNWDFSRSAVATPLTQVQDPVRLAPQSAVLADEYPDSAGPYREPVLVNALFSYKSVVLPVAAQKALKALPSNAAYVVAGYADSKEPRPAAIAEKRALAVAGYLRKTGKRVETTTAHGDQYAKGDPGSKANRHVEVFAKP